MNIRQRPSPNHGPRRSGTVIDCIVLHADAAGTVAQSLSWIVQPKSGVSYHYLIGRLGDVYQCVADERRAWHAGVSSFDGRHDVNTYSIGVSFGNRCDGVERYRTDQLEVGLELCRLLMRRWPAITPDRITTHQAIALPAGRKVDPGPLFPFDDFVAELRGLVGAGL